MEAEVEVVAEGLQETSQVPSRPKAPMAHSRPTRQLSQADQQVPRQTNP